RMLLLGLLLAQQLLDTKLPAIVLRQILADRQVRMLAALANEHLFRTGPVPPDVLAKMPLYQFYMLERFGDRAQVIWRHLPSLLNPLRILKTYGLTPIKHLLGLQTKQ
ncbi:MAG: hypothetical protein HGA65_17655, partial [Oscillochloris sp.]|nr:hypothetical protein [Oscillochloris sp.]